MSQSGGFDMSKMSTAHKILLGAGILYIIDVFLPWQRVCFDLGSRGERVRFGRAVHRASGS